MLRRALVIGMGARMRSGIKAGWCDVLTACDPFSCRTVLLEAPQ